MDEKRDLIIPSLEELRNIYKRKMREEIRRENYRKIMYAEDEGLFFNRFRKVEDFSQKNVEVSDEAYDIYEIYRVREEKYASQRIEEFENKIAFEKFFLKWEREADRKRNLNSRFSTNAATRARVDRIMDLEGKLNHFVSNSEAAYDVYYGNKLLEDIENQRYGRLINTGYVSDAREKIIKSLENGEAVNITGHLGSGKTAIAVEAAIEFTVERRIQEYLEDELEKWYLKNREADYEDALEEFSVLNRGIRKHYRDIVNESSGESWKSLRPLFISGSHNLTYEDMFVEKTLKLESSFEKQSFGKYLDILTDNFYEWINEHKKELDIMTDKEAMNIKIEIWKSLSDILVAKNSSFGTEIKKVEKEILTAIRQGRVVIVDELNAIAMQNLIGLNDILQKKIGEYAYITGVGSVRIKPGFGFIGTGNLSTQSINYEGTNDLNPAFKSRFVNIEYNYLPQSIRGDVYSQENREANELFRVIMTRLMDNGGNIRLPYPQKSVDELFRFAQLSRVTQNIFMGKWKEGGEEAGLEELELKESVLSIRNIMRVLDEWNLGEEKDLSKAIWDGFLSSITNPDDQSYILSQCLRFGFFSKADGWDVKIKYRGEATTSFDEIRSDKYTYSRPEIEVLCRLDMVDIIFGRFDGEDRKLKRYLGMADSEDKEKLDIAKYKKYISEINSLKRAADLMDYTAEDSYAEDVDE